MEMNRVDRKAGFKRAICLEKNQTAQDAQKEADLVIKSEAVNCKISQDGKETATVKIQMEKQHRRGKEKWFIC